MNLKDFLSISTNISLELYIIDAYEGDTIASGRICDLLHDEKYQNIWSMQVSGFFVNPVCYTMNITVYD